MHGARWDANRSFEGSKLSVIGQVPADRKCEKVSPVVVIFRAYGAVKFLDAHWTAGWEQGPSAGLVGGECS